MELISIIVPVYNVKEYLRECIDSIRQQTYKNIEIILIDDGSTDGSGDICEHYADKDSRIKVLHQEHKGPSASRNAGMRRSEGDYIAFVDSDDMVLPRFLEVLHRLIKKYHADIAICNYTRNLGASANKKTSRRHRRQAYVIPSGELLRQWHGKRKHLETMVWNKLYAKKILDNQEFTEGTVHEDTLISHCLIQRAGKTAVTNEILYYYRERPNSITATYDSGRIRQDLQAQRARMQFFKENKYYGAYLRLLKGHLLHRMMYLLKAVK